MVMILPPPDVCSLDMVDNVVAERAGGVNARFFSSISAEWRARVPHYITYGGSPEHVGTWPAVKHKRQSFHTLYSSPAKGSAQGLVIKSLRDGHNLDLCPACGEP